MCNQTIRREEDLAATTTMSRHRDNYRSHDTMYARVCKDGEVNARYMDVDYKRKHRVIYCNMNQSLYNDPADQYLRVSRTKVPVIAPTERQSTCLREVHCPFTR